MQFNVEQMGFVTPGPEVKHLQVLTEFCTLWHAQTCLIGSGPDGKHTALEAVTVVLDLPPPPPLAMTGSRSVDRADPKSAIALQRLVQAAVSQGSPFDLSISIQH